MITHENTWTKPKALVDKENSSKENGIPQMSPIPMQAVGYAGFRPSVATGGPQQILSGGIAPAKNDKSRPVSSNAVAGTPWCVVWTGDNRVGSSFFKFKQS